MKPEARKLSDRGSNPSPLVARQRRYLTVSDLKESAVKSYGFYGEVTY